MRKNCQTYISQVKILMLVYYFEFYTLKSKNLNYLI